MSRSTALSLAILVLGASPCAADEPTRPQAQAHAAGAPEQLEASKLPHYGVAKRFPVGGDGGWDYLVFDGASRRLFVSRSTHVMVLDPDSGKIIGDIPGTEGVHGIALAPDLKRGFTSNGRSATVSVFDLATLLVSARVKTTGENPDAILYEPVSKRVFTFNGRGRNATVLDAAAGTVVGTVPLGGKPETGVSDDSGKVYVNIEDKSEVAVIDPKTLTAGTRWPLPGCDEPTGLAIDAKRERLFAGCHNRLLLVLSSVDGSVVSRVPMGEGNDAVSFEAETGLVFASNGDGTLAIIRETSPGSYAAVQTVSTEKGARTHALDPKTHRIFLSSARFGPPPSPTADRPNPRPGMVPGSFEILVVGP